MSKTPLLQGVGGRETKKIKLVQYTEVDALFTVPSSGEQCELCGRNVPKSGKTRQKEYRERQRG